MENESIYGPPRDKTNKVACASSEDSDQPAHPPSLIRVFACADWVAKDPSFLNADAQADLNLRWEHMPLCWFCDVAAHI